MSVGRWSHVEPPTILPDWVSRTGYAGLFAASMGTPATAGRASGLLLAEDILLVVRAVALPAGPSPRYAVIVDMPVTELLKAKLREATSVKLGAGERGPLGGDEAGAPDGRGDGRGRWPPAKARGTPTAATGRRR